MDTEGMNSMIWDTVEDESMIQGLEKYDVQRAKKISNEEYRYTVSTPSVPRIEVVLEGISASGDPLAGTTTVHMKIAPDGKVEALLLNGTYMIKRF